MLISGFTGSYVGVLVLGGRWVFGVRMLFSLFLGGFRMVLYLVFMVGKRGVSVGWGFGV